SGLFQGVKRFWVATILTPPVITSASSIFATRGVQEVFYQVAATRNPAAMTATGLPLGLTFNSATGTISGKVMVSGDYPIDLQAENEEGTGRLTLVLHVGDPPAITGLSSTAGQVGADFLAQI